MIRRFIFGISVLGLVLSAGARAQGALPYEREYPGVNYTGTPLSDPFTRLMERVETGEVELAYDAEGRGFLDSLLEALDIDPSSQMLVFSKTARKQRLITAATPRAIYFNDEVFVAFAQNGSSLEVAAMDPRVGPVFFDLSQDPADAEPYERELNTCLRCHDSFSLTGGGVPRFMLSSVLADASGRIVSHEVNMITDTSVPLNRRWGGWYVTGTHGDQLHLGNLIIADRGPSREDLAKNGNRRSLDGLFDTAPYPHDNSDIVALLVAEHQVEVYNAITRARYDALKVIGEGGATVALEAVAEPLLESLLMAHEAPLQGPVEGTSGYADYFQQLGPRDAQGRSLRELDLRTRTFKYPLSYLVYSEAFAALPAPLKTVLYARLREILGAQESSGAYAHLAGDTRHAILSILEDTSPEFADADSL